MSSSSSNSSSSSYIERWSSSSSSSSTSTSSSQSLSTLSSHSSSYSSSSSTSSKSSSSSSSSYIDNWSSSSSSSTENRSSSSSSYIENWSSSSSSSSSSSYLDYHSNKTMPFTFEVGIINPVWTLLPYGEYIYAGTGSDGVVLKSKDRQFWGQMYKVDDLHVTALCAVDNKLYIGTSPKGYVYITDLSDFTTTLSQELGGKVVDFCYFQSKIYAVTSSPSYVYIYNIGKLQWEEFYKPYSDVVNKMFVKNDKMYLIMDASNFIHFDGSSWIMNEVSDNISSFRNVTTEPFSYIDGELLNRSSITTKTGLTDSDIYDVFPSNYAKGIKSADSDGNSIVLGASGCGRVYNYYNGNLYQIYQNDGSNVYSILNLDVGKNLVSIDSKLYLVYCGDLTTTTTTTLISDTETTTTATTTALPVIKVIYPTSNTYVTVGETITITWNSNKSVNDAVSIDLVQDNKIVQSINSKTFNDGSYEWIIPSTNIGVYKVRITWLSAGQTSDSENQGDSEEFQIVYTVPTTTTTTTTILDTTIPNTSDCRGIPILDLLNDEYITNMIKDTANGGVLFATSNGRILGCRESFINSYLTGERNVFAEVKNEFGNLSDTAYTDFFYALHNKIVEINSSKEIVKYKFVEDPSAVMSDRINGVFLSPIMYVKEDLGIWKQLLWSENKAANTDITICLRSANSTNDLMKKPWDYCFDSNNTGVSTNTHNINDTDINGKYIQFKVIMSTDAVNVTPSILYLSLSYTTKFAVYFFTVRFTLENSSNIKTGLLTATITQPQNTEIKFGIAGENTIDWSDYKTVDINKFFELNGLESVKVGIKMISYDSNTPEVAEFSLITGGDIDNKLND